MFAHVYTTLIVILIIFSTGNAYIVLPKLDGNCTTPVEVHNVAHSCRQLVCCILGI